MKHRSKPLRILVHGSVISLLAMSAAHAAGFSLYAEGAGYTAGNYAAGSAAEAADASIGWYNPAGLALLREQQLVLGGTGIFPTLKLDGTSTYNTLFPSPLPPIDYVQNVQGVDGGSNAVVPAFHYALPLNERTTFGLSVTAPFGLATDWGSDSALRYSATYTQLETVDISPEIGTRLTEHFALGAGFDLQWSHVTFNQTIGAPTVFGTIGDDPALVDIESYNKGSSWGVGFHVGAMGLFNNNHTRIGINYQSKVRHVFHGSSRLSGSLANNFNLFGPIPASGMWKNNDLFSNAQKFPDVLTLSSYQDVTDQLALLGSVVFTGWNVFKTTQLNNVVVPEVSNLGDVSRAHISTIVPQNFHDAWRVSVGANYRINPKLMLRFGGGYDENPSNNRDRNIRLPDVDRWALACGAHYQWRPHLGIDVGYTHLFGAHRPNVDTTQILSSTSSVSVAVDGGRFSADLLGAQLTWIIDDHPRASK